jgi:hypothetical protein
LAVNVPENGIAALASPNLADEVEDRLASQTDSQYIAYRLRRNRHRDVPPRHPQRAGLPVRRRGRERLGHPGVFAEDDLLPIELAGACSSRRCPDVDHGEIDCGPRGPQGGTLGLPIAWWSGSVSTSPATWSHASASRIGVRLTPTRAEHRAKQRSPGSSVPSVIA